MEVFKINSSFTNIPKINKPINLCLGYFDGVHIAHQQLINKALNINSNKIGVLTFADNVKNKSILTSVDGRLALFKSLNVDIVFILPFNKKIKSLEWKKFIELFFCKINIDFLIAGTDYTFGSGAKGNIKSLKKYFKVIEIPLVKKSGNKISSSEISTLIKNGEIKKANKLLGRPYDVKGKVTRGYGHGSELKYPTANINFRFNYVIPKYGVYKVIIFVLGIPHLAIANVGIHPTVNKLKKPIIEVHIPNFNDNIYNEDVYIEFIDFIRPEKKFKNEKDLIKQIELDIASLKRF